jgi:hypothetical protein
MSKRNDEIVKAAQAAAQELPQMLAGGAMANTYAMAALIAALGEKQAVDPARVFELFGTIIAGFEAGDGKAR